MSGLLAPENLPFAVALALLALLVIVQVTGLSDLLGDADGPDADLDAGSALASIAGLGSLPFISRSQLSRTGPDHRRVDERARARRQIARGTGEGGTAHSTEYAGPSFSRTVAGEGGGLTVTPAAWRPVP